MCAVTNYIVTSGFWPRVRAHALRAPVFLGSLPHQTGRCASPPAHRSFAASYSALKNIYNLSNLGHPRQGLFSIHSEAKLYNVPCHHSCADPTSDINDTYVEKNPAKCPSLAKNPPKYTTAYIVQQSNCRWHCEPLCLLGWAFNKE